MATLSRPSLLLLLIILSIFQPILLVECLNNNDTIFFSNLTDASNNGGGGKDREAMDALIIAITKNPHNWDLTDYCEWDGITCDGPQHHVTSINLSFQDLTGVLPSNSFNSFSHLHSLFLQHNKFYGPIPRLTNLPLLKEVDISSNSFTQILPGTFAKLPLLINLDLSNNPHLTPWTFPYELIGSKTLRSLRMDNTNIKGQIPRFVVSFKSLENLNLSHNFLTGTVPEALLSLPRVANIDISYNKLSGRIPVFEAGVSVLYAGNDFTVKSVSRKSRIRDMLLGFIILLLCLVAFLVVVFLVALEWCKRQRPSKQDKEVRNIEANNELRGSLTFTHQELINATNSFELPRKIGSGGSSDVYRGILSNGANVAVKHLKKFSPPIINMFIREVLLLDRLHHDNVVKLMGYCLEGTDMYIVYEFMEEGSLADRIFRGSGEPDLTWGQKKKIVRQIAKGLRYLHKKGILHQDIKPQNVLLDVRLNAKVSDFGLATILRNDEARVSNQERGTWGYVAPEIFGGEMFSQKSDVYSYGIVVLETMFEKKSWIQNRSEISIPLVDMVRSQVQVGEIIGPREQNMPEFQSETLLTAKLALWCLNDDPEHRPSMEEVVKVLDGTLTIPEDEVQYY